MQQQIRQQGLLARLVNGRQQAIVVEELEAAQQLNLEHGMINQSTEVNDRPLASYLPSQSIPAQTHEHILAGMALLVKQSIMHLGQSRT